MRLSLCLILFLVAGAGPLVAADPARTPDVIASLKPYVDDRALAGAVTLVVDKDRVLSHQAIGWADIAGKKPMAPDALFWIASMSKPITATVLMMLVDEDKVEIEAPVSRYLPEFARMWVRSPGGKQGGRREASTPITVRHLLSHTSGLPFFNPEEVPKVDVPEIAASAALSAKQVLAFEPGTAWSYSNAGIKVAGRIIEVVAGKPFETVMRERLFDPLGMVDTTSFPDAAQIARLPKAYKPNLFNTALVETPIGFLSYPLDARTRFACPGGGFFSTARDLARFARLFLGGGELDGRRHLSQAAIRQMTTMQTGALNVGFGLGFALPGEDYGHGGAYHTDLWFDTRHGLATIFLVQHEEFLNADGDDILTAFKQAAVVAYTRR
jgi:CubicO group peptidase (beta-lactamase class C family)